MSLNRLYASPNGAGLRDLSGQWIAVDPSAEVGVVKGGGGGDAGGQEHQQEEELRDSQG
jgi:hypothetical protein